VKQYFLAMESNRVWESVLMSSMPPGRKIGGNRWVLIENDDGTLRSTTLEQDISQEPRKYFTDSHATVITDVAFRLSLIICVHKIQHTEQFDIEKAFLYSAKD
jgi:hypothetical protein